VVAVMTKDITRAEKQPRSRHKEPSRIDNTGIRGHDFGTVEGGRRGVYGAYIRGKAGNYFNIDMSLGKGKPWPRLFLGPGKKKIKNM